MPRGHPRRNCKTCERSIEECGPLSARGKCTDCGEGRMLGNALELHAHSGPWFDHWRRRTLAAFGVVVVDRSSERE